MVASTGTALCASQLSQRMYAARPVTWRGRGDLAQVPWSRPCKGTWLVLDCWAGFGGLCIGLLQLGWHFYCAAAEMDPVAAQVAQHNTPNIVHVDLVEHLHASDFAPFLARRNIRGVLIGGGSPCQGNSSLNLGRRHLDDPRSCQPAELCRLRAEFQSLPECQGLEIVVFLENVASMAPQVQSQYDEWMKGQAICIDAASCGWVQRKRLYWLVAAKGHVSADVAPPEPWTWAHGSESSATPTLVYRGAKPCPARVFFQQGYQPLFDPTDVLAQGGTGAMHTLTREFRHPTDRVRSVSAEAAARFEADYRRFPPASYEDRSLLWQGDRWRQALPEERAQLHGLPASCLCTVPGDPAVKIQRQNSLIGNGFHLFSILVLFSMLPAVLGNKLGPQLKCPDEMALRQRLLHSVWEPGRIDGMPGLLSARDVVMAMPPLFPQCTISPTVWAEVERKLAVCRLQDMQFFRAWCKLRGHDLPVLGPQPLLRRDRAQVFAGLGGQRYAADSARGLDPLLPPGLGKERHMAASATLPSPFAPRPWPELDVAFNIDAIAIWQAYLPRVAARFRHVLSTIARALEPLEAAVAPFRVASAARVAHTKKPALVACLTILLQWPDTWQAHHLLAGYPIVGDIAPSGVFRDIDGQAPTSFDDWLADSEAVVDRILQSRPPRFHAEILKATQEEQAKGFCSQFYTRAEVDKLFHHQPWRPLERFIIRQADNKMRVIDNCRKTQHNLNTTMHETIHTVQVDFVAAVAADLCRRLNICAPPHSNPALDWLRLRIGTDDLPDAYRGLPVKPDHQRYSVVAIYIDNLGWRFTVLWGLAFGLESAVVAFNRFPQFGIAVARRCLLALTAAYFDDELAVEMVADAEPSQQGLRLVFKLLGAPPQASKGFSAASDRHYLGSSVRTGDFVTLGVIRIQPKYFTSQKVLQKLDAALLSNQLTRDDAGKLRGDLMWFFSMCMGHLGKLAGPVLTAHQRGDESALSKEEASYLRALRAAVCVAQPRDVLVLHQSPPVTRIYSDASFENDILRLGWVIFIPGTMPVAGTCIVPPEVISTWKHRSQQIFPGETVAALVIALIHGPALGARDAIHFVDNQASVASLVRVTSSEVDVLFIVQQVHLAYLRIKSRMWYEWLDSDSNPADGLSRSGLSDAWTLAQPWAIQEYSFPEVLDPPRFLELISGLGFAC